ncbi:MAG: response regulator [Deltaproteobacteria bacterium]|nr:response regulator [Deltaproteobacteria bacterium]
MLEVSGRVTAVVLDSAERRGLDVAACIDGLPFTRAALSDPSRRFDWDTLADLSANIERVCGGEDVEELLVTRGDRSGHPFVSFTRVLLRAQDSYRFLARWGLPRNIVNARATFDDLGDGKAAMTVRLDEKLRGSVAFLRLFAGILRGLPGVVGLPPATVTLTAKPHEATYELRLPDPPTLAGRTRQLVSRIAGAPVSIDELAARAIEIQDQNTQLEARVAELRRGERALREKEEFLRLALKAGRVGIWSWDIASDELTLSAGSTTANRLLEATPKPTFDLYLSRVHPDDRPDLERIVEETLAGRELSSEHRIEKDDGTLIWVRATGEVVRDDHGKPRAITGTVVDVSEQKQLERQLLFANRMIAVGKLAAGVAHELNNPLGYVMTNVSLMKKHLEQLEANGADVTAMRSALDAAEEGAERMRDIMGDLRTFARPNEDRRRVLDLRRILEASARLVAHEIAHRAELVIEHGDNLPKVLGNESRVGQVFTNLLVNAAHAIPEDRSRPGRVRIRTHRDTDGWAVVSVEDNGEGIGPRVMKRIFEPFFTTKEVGQGTGLGLAVCESIVTSLGGRIEVESEVGRGSTFRVRLPPSDQREHTPEPVSHAHPSGGRILVIDDEPRFGASLKMLLETYGFVVDLAETAKQGLKLATTAPSYDVILCDLMMPGETGMDLHTMLESTRPDLSKRVVFLTGGAFTPRASQFLDGIANAYLDKPLDLDRLLAVIEGTKRKFAAP